MIENYMLKTISLTKVPLTKQFSFISIVKTKFDGK